MSNVIEDYKKINLPKTALTLIFPDGKVISINKIKGFNYHMEYLKLLSKNYKEVKTVISGIDLDYYLVNPTEAMGTVWPLFSMENITVYMNSAPNVYAPTEDCLILLPEQLTKASRNILKKMDNKLESIKPLGIGHYYNDDAFYDIREVGLNEMITSDSLFEIVDEKIKSVKKL